jgi:hypothetical protein
MISVGIVLSVRSRSRPCALGVGSRATHPKKSATSVVPVLHAVTCCDMLWHALLLLLLPQVTIDPDTPEAAELRAWWSSEGSTATITPLGQVCAVKWLLTGSTCPLNAPTTEGSTCTLACSYRQAMQGTQLCQQGRC